MVESLSEKIDGTVANPAGKHLKKVNEDCPKLDTDRAEVVLSVIAKSLYFTKRTRPDVEPTMAF